FFCSYVFTDPAPTVIYTLSLHDALPIFEKMNAEGMNYPLHLGVTEAGDGEDGRIKSAVGIGTLLEDGLGDTVRVSLTEEPELERSEEHTSELQSRENIVCRLLLEKKNTE